MSASGQTRDTDIVLRLTVLDKQVATFQRVELVASRLVTAQVLLSLLLIALSAGLVSTEEALEVTGIKLELPFWLGLGSGAVAVAVVTVLGVMHDRHAHHLNRAIVSAYEELGLTAPREAEERGLGLMSGSGDIAANLFRRVGVSVFAVTQALAVACLFALLPLIAQLVVLTKLAGDFGWTWSVWLPLGAALLISVWALLWGFTDSENF